MVIGYADLGFMPLAAYRNPIISNDNDGDEPCNATRQFLVGGRQKYRRQKESYAQRVLIVFNAKENHEVKGE